MKDMKGREDQTFRDLNVEEFGTNFFGWENRQTTKF